ncbi:heme-binding protein [Weeksellaceae bacterium TAE3-ERU29]|nr:heme-binding protein [Weeksellaceae bacterium TAE3-ERU29]
MKRILSTALLVISFITFAQTEFNNKIVLDRQKALSLAEQANQKAREINKEVSVAVVNPSGVTLLLLKGNNVGPHNTEASRRKAYTAVSTKNSTLELMRKAAKSQDAQNLNTLPELLLLGGGSPIWNGEELIGAIGVSGAGGGENDQRIAEETIKNLGFSIEKQSK